jgi:hypothetical protein
MASFQPVRWTSTPDGTNASSSVGPGPWEHPGAGSRFLVEGGVAVVVLVVVEASQRAVASRSRPALPQHVLKADDAIRRVGAPNRLATEARGCS